MTWRRWPLFWLLFALICTPDAGSETELASSPGHADSPIWNARLEFRGKKWFNKISFRFESGEVRPNGDDSAGAGSSGSLSPSKLLRACLITDFDPLVGPKIHLSDTSWFDPSTLSAERQLRTRAGRDETFKIYDFIDGGVRRLRREPENQKQASDPPDTWSDIKETFYPFPPKAYSCEAIATPAVLFPLVSSLAGATRVETSLACIFDRKNTYLVSVESEELAPSVNDSLEVQVAGRGKVRMGSAGIVRFRINPEYLGEDQGAKSDFSFGGLSGEVLIFVDRATALPIRIVGSLSSFGEIELKLHKAALEPPGKGSRFNDERK